MERQTVDIRSRCSEVMELSKSLRVWLHVIVQISFALTVNELRSLCSALLYSKMGRAFPTLLKNMVEILFERRFRGCHLQYTITEKSLDPSKYMLLYPRCQCLTMTRPPQFDPKAVVSPDLRAEPRLPCGAAASRRYLHRARKVMHVVPVTMRSKCGQRVLHVPEYTCASGWSKESVARDNAMVDSGGLVSVPPRFANAPSGVAVPVRLQGVRRFAGAAAAFNSIVQACSVQVSEILFTSSRQDHTSYVCMAFNRQPLGSLIDLYIGCRLYAPVLYDV